MDIGSATLLVGAFALALVGAIKKAFPTWATGKEELLAIAIPLIVFPILKTTHTVDVSWANLINAVLASTLGAGVAHDKIVNPLMARKKQPSDQPK